MSDRALQDEVIRALADGPFRSSTVWQDRDLADPDRVERFARFLARRYYYERVVHFFRYSRALARVTGRRPEAALAGPEFNALLPGIVLGSRETAHAVAELVVEYVKRGDRAEAIAYVDDLLRYEGAMMVVEAGPRRWRENGATPVVLVDADAAPAMADGTVILELEFNLPEILPLIVRAWSDPPLAPHRPCRLVVARTPRGRVSVAQLTEPITEAIVAANGRLTLRDLAEATGAELGALREAFASLTEIGAVRFSIGS